MRVAQTLMNVDKTDLSVPVGSVVSTQKAVTGVKVRLIQPLRGVPLPVQSDTPRTQTLAAV